MIEIVEAEGRHIRELVRNLRVEDREEIEFCRIPIARALWGSFRGSLYRRTALVDGGVAAAWGFSGAPGAAEGRLWLMTTPLIESIKLTFLRRAKEEVVRGLDFYPRVVVWSGPQHKKARNLLSHLGFLLEGSDPPGLLRFSVERDNGI